MEVRRTVRVKLDVDSDDSALLHDTVDEFLFAANYVVDHAWQGKKKTTSKAQLQRETYNDVRTETPLNAGLVQNARNKAADADRRRSLAGNKASTLASHTSRSRR